MLQSRLIQFLFILLLFPAILAEAQPAGEMDTLIVERRIEPRDVLTITVLQHQELSQEVVVYPDGTTSYPILSGIYVIGMTLEQLTTLVQTLLAPLISQPTVFISVAGVRTVYCEVHGAVVHPGKVYAEAPLSLQEALTMAGGVIEKADKGSIQITRDMGGTRKTITYNLLEYLQSDSTSPIFIENGDLIFIPLESASKQVRVVGAVNFPGVYSFIPNENLLDLLYRAGGFKDMSNIRKIRLYTIAGKNRTLEVYDIDEYLKTGKIDQLPLIKQGDIIVVPKHPGWKDLSFWSQLVRDLALLLSAAVVVARL